jgi:hypothetical protein
MRTHVLLPQPYMREAWRVEHKFAQHKGQCLDELLVQLLMHGRALELDAAIDKCSKTPGSSPGLSPSSSMEELVPGQEAMAAAEGLLAGHVFPVYPGPAAGVWNAWYSAVRCVVMLQVCGMHGTLQWLRDDYPAHVCFLGCTGQSSNLRKRVMARLVLPI